MKLNHIYKSIACGVLLAMTATSCDLDYNPVDTYSDVTEGVNKTDEKPIFNSVQDVETSMVTLHKKFRDRQEHWYVDKLLIGDAHSDNAYAGTTGAEVVPYETNSIDASNSVLSRDWNRYLEDIAQANVLINGVEQLKESGQISDTEYHSYKAQGEIFRALMMFRMARLWGSFPVITTIAQTITSDNINEVYPTYYPPRKSPKECYEQIIADLTDAEKYAPDNDNSDRTKMTKTVAQAMLAKVYAEKEVQDYDKVITYADKVIKTTGVELEDSYETLWGYDETTKDCLKRNTKEGILEVHWTTGGGNWETWMYGRQLDNWDYYFTWAKWITPSRDIINDFEKEGDEIRKNQAIVYYACTWSNYYPASNYPFMYKLRSSYSNIYWIRLADIILMKAEAEAYKGNLDESAKLVNQIRKRAKLKELTSDKTNSKEAMIEAVLHERRLELAFEGERWFDLCRNNKVEKYLNGIDNRDKGRIKQVKLFDSNSYLLPIPQTALDQNTNLVQNPGY